MRKMSISGMENSMKKFTELKVDTKIARCAIFKLFSDWLERPNAISDWLMLSDFVFLNSLP